VAAEITETTSAYARLVAAIEPEWVTAAVPNLIKRAHSLPAFDADRGRVLVREEQSLQGLTLAADVMVDYATIDADAARDLTFGEHGETRGHHGMHGASMHCDHTQRIRRLVDHACHTPGQALRRTTRPTLTMHTRGIPM
jgi:HrpA-like RNA helicase